MKNRIIAVLLALTLSLALPGALAAGVRMESVEYKGFGVLDIEFSRESEWFPAAIFTLTDETGLAIEATVIAGEEENAWLYAPEIVDGAAYSLQFVLGETDQTVPFTADTALEHRVNKNNEVTVREDREKCDFCRAPGHDDDFCPERINPADIPAEPADVARFFDIDDFCERCGGIGHDDDRCPNH